ncbi:EFR1 family ferrodoxin [Bacteroides sp. OttesenSCG-928-M17]|nr:EFR1 family ferrodoxin [Bacteroides sp. OttesenSCG-928-M17]
MIIENINSVYFTATNTTRRVVRHIAEQLQGNKKEYNITQSAPEENITMKSSDLLVVGMPVYSGRIPAIALPALDRFKGNGTPAIIVCVYGNRDYDDALLELKDVVESNGFKVISAGAFIAQHSIFPKVGHNRPDEKDMEQIKEFADKSAALIAATPDISSLPEITPEGNRPYKVPGNLPLQPKGNKQCTECGACVKQCPAQAIAADTPRKTDKNKCISCARCIMICPENARHFGGLMYKTAGVMFVRSFSERKEPTVLISAER